MCTVSLAISARLRIFFVKHFWRLIWVLIFLSFSLLLVYLYWPFYLNVSTGHTLCPLHWSQTHYYKVTVGLRHKIRKLLRCMSTVFPNIIWYDASIGQDAFIMFQWTFTAKITAFTHFTKSNENSNGTCLKTPKSCIFYPRIFYLLLKYIRSIVSLQGFFILSFQF